MSLYVLVVGNYKMATSNPSAATVNFKIGWNKLQWRYTDKIFQGKNRYF
jgi:hypothetical protein